MANYKRIAGAGAVGFVLGGPAGAVFAAALAAFVPDDPEKVYATEQVENSPMGPAPTPDYVPYNPVENEAARQETHGASATDGYRGFGDFTKALIGGGAGFFVAGPVGALVGAGVGYVMKPTERVSLPDTAVGVSPPPPRATEDHPMVDSDTLTTHAADASEANYDGSGIKAAPCIDCSDAKYL